MTKRFSLTVVLGFSLLFLSACTGTPDRIEPVRNFELNRYLGEWYEIARLDHPFERGLSKITANYSLRDDGGVKVINRGYNTEEGQWDTAEGKAYFVGEDDVGHLKVSFFGPFYASYVVMELDKDNYRYSMVTGPDRDYLWILSRTPTLDEATLQRLVGIARDAGYPVDELIYVNQQ
ncbi:lipocalin family protein [Alteromonas sp. CYL-A6]|uniref:lipocalin family protein n=1 Tax=Alteromonas nitratireducens TaxID=3390813 RepID=UPI0034B95E34